MKEKLSALFSKKYRQKRRNVGQTVAVLVMAFVVAAGGLGTTALLASQPAGLTVEPASQQWVPAAASEQQEARQPAAPKAKDSAQPEAEPSAESPAAAEPQAEAAPEQPESPAVPQEEAQPEAPATAEPQTAAEPEQPVPTPEPEAPALPAFGGDVLEEENALPLFQQETPELAAEDPLAPPEAENTGLEAQLSEQEADAMLLTPEEIQEALDTGALTAEDGRSIDLNEENGLWDFLVWLLKVLTGGYDTPKYSGWRTVDGQTYYYSQSTNEPLTGIQSIDGKLYYFNQNGVMQNVTFGIDVSKYQSKLDWNKVKQAGAEFVIIRIGYRGYETGALVLDPRFEEHYAGARSAGLRVGVYLFSQAINEAEAREEAFGCAYVLNGRPLDYPIFFDSEASGASGGTGRADSLGVAERTACAVAFCEEVLAQGYRPGVYASTLWFRQRLDLSQLMNYTIWNAHYGVPNSGIPCNLWQGSCTARIDGYDGQLDVNISYIG